jgi:hypothetical protein
MALAPTLRRIRVDRPVTAGREDDEMRGIDARALLARVMHDEAPGGGTSRKLEGGAMGVLHAEPAVTEG